MQPAGDPYRVLGVGRDATPGEVKSAHRRLAKAHHPDAGGDPARFLAIQAAYQVLADPVQRSRWDAAHSPGPVPAHDPWAARPRPDRPGRQPGAARERGPARSGRGAAPAAEGRSAAQGRQAAQGRPAADPSPGAGGGAVPGRDPASASWTWTASGVPWWEEGGRRGGGGNPGPGVRGPRAGSGGGATPAAGERGSGHRRGRATRSAEDQANTAPGDRPEAGPRDPTGTDPTGTDPTRAWRAGQPGDPGRSRAGSAGGATMDAFVRSSGAAWSAASRAYFRKVTAEIPHGARLGHSSRTGRVGWEPSPEEIARAAAGDPAPDRPRSGGPPPDAGPAAGPPPGPVGVPLGGTVRRLATRVVRAIRG